MRIVFLLASLVAAVSAGPASAADPASPAVQLAAEEADDLLTRDYYQIEFFVFERPGVMEFNTEELLALNRPRALPATMRSQLGALESFADLVIDPTTRACLTFPTISYSMQQPRRSASVPAASAGGARPPEIQPTLSPDPVLDLLRGIAAFERELEAASQRWLPEQTFVLAAEARSVERRGIGRVLFHGRWLQVVPARDAPDPVYIRTGTLLDSPVAAQELEGTVGVTLGRYLHFQAELFYHAPGLGMDLIDVPQSSAGDALLGAPEAVEFRYMKLSESRRMRSTETHYLDHPKLGLVVRIDPPEIPAPLVEAFEALKEPVE